MEFTVEEEAELTRIDEEHHQRLLELEMQRYERRRAEVVQRAESRRQSAVSAGSNINVREVEGRGNENHRPVPAPRSRRESMGVRPTPAPRSQFNFDGIHPIIGPRADERVSNRPVAAPRAEVLNFIRNYQENVMVPLFEDMNEYGEFSRKASRDDSPIGDPLRSSTPNPASCPVPVRSSTSDIANAIKEGFQQLLPCIAGSSGVRPSPADDAATAILRRQNVEKDLPVFSGEPEEWLAFITQYKTTNKICGFKNFENLARLHKCLKGKAREAVRPILTMPENVDRVIETLESLFGQPQHIVRHLIHKTKNAIAPHHSKPESIVTFSNYVQNMVSTMEALKCYGDLGNPQLLLELAMKLPYRLQEQWCEVAASSPRGPDLQFFSSWLAEKARGASLQALLKPMTVDGDNRDKRGEKRSAGTFLVATEKKAKTNDGVRGCFLCSETGHRAAKCPKLTSADVTSRWEMVRAKKLCFGCLAPGHRTTECTKKLPCGVDGCRQTHHKLLHQDQRQGREGALVHHVASRDPSILLRIIPVKLMGPLGEVNTYAFFDEGSTRSMLEEGLARELGLSGPRQPFCMTWTHGHSRHEPDSRRVSVGISGVSDGATKFTLHGVRTVSPMNLPTQSIDMNFLAERWPYLRGLPVESFRDARPQLLLGHDNYLLTAPRKVLQGTWVSPVATNTWLGWVVHGAKPAHGNIEREYNFHLCEQPAVDMNYLHQIVKDSFSIENFGVKLTNPTRASREDLKAKEILERTTIRVGERWQTGLLWRNAAVTTPDSKPVALQRLCCLEKRMDRDRTFAEGYVAKMQDLLDKGYVRKLTTDETDKRWPREWFFPHFGVVNANKPGKVRIVFDAAAKSRGVSFNDYMLTGPDYLLSIVAVLWRFRKFKYAFASDIKEMFLRILLSPTEIYSQLFYWRGMDRSRNPDVYAVVVVCFGGTSSPCSANYVKIRNAEEFAHEFPEALTMVQKQSYMDDYMGGADSKEDCIQIIHDLIEVHKRGGFELCNWTCNSKDILAEIPSELKGAGVKDLSPEMEIPIERVLGMHWNPQYDYFTYKLNFHKVTPEIKDGTQVPTKRQMLQLIMSIFDPLGFLAFFTIKGRILLQSVWKLNIGWDDKISGDYTIRWRKWVQELQQISTVQISRCYSHSLSEAKSVQLHVFCDASNLAYAAVAFLRIEVDHSPVEVVLMGAKTRVAPLKPISIPRLELQGALMAARLVSAIRSELELSFSAVHLWCDSMTVLSWIRTQSGRLKQYEANRVGEILESTNSQQWHYIPTKENVADDATRDQKPCDFSKTSRWFAGPSFLKHSEDKWPKEIQRFSVSTELEAYNFVGAISNEIEYLPDIRKFSSFTKLIRVTAWLLRPVLKYRNRTKRFKCLTPDELQFAEFIWMKRVQANNFSSEIKSLIENKPIDKCSKLYQLSPHLNDKGLVVMKGRIDLALDLPEAVKRPVILEPNHEYTKLLIQHYHERMNHQGQETVINELRQKYWILQVRTAVKKVVRRCQICKNKHPRQVIPEMGQLPECRLLKKVRPFTYCGLDYFGPINVKSKKSKEKKYGVIFTCMSTRAIHLELAGSLTTSTAINAIRRFVGRRGQPMEIISDNGTNLKGADAELKLAIAKLNNEEIVETTMAKGIRWKFIPPASPHMGGSWERLIRSVKTALQASLKATCPTEETLSTFIVEVENIVNSRPLTQVSLDPEDPESLTPNHFLLGSSSGAPSTGVKINHKKDLKVQWKYTQLLTDRFWQRWVKEYLPTLARRTKWFHTPSPLKIGDMVIIADSKSPRNSWPLGRIVSIYPGPDGKVRTADVKTKFGVFRRPAVKLCKLDVDKPTDKSEPSSSYGG